MRLAVGQGELREWQQRLISPADGGAVGDPNGGPWAVGTLLVHNVVGPRKWLVQSESAIARRLYWVVLSETKKLEEILCRSENLEFIVPLPQQVVLLAVDPFLVSILVA